MEATGFPTPVCEGSPSRPAPVVPDGNPYPIPSLTALQILLVRFRLSPNPPSFFTPDLDGRASEEEAVRLHFRHSRAPV